MKISSAAPSSFSGLQTNVPELPVCPAFQTPVHPTFVVMTTQSDFIGYSSKLLSIVLSRDWEEPRTKLQLGRHASGRATELGSSLT
jgi:hypothetical protein